MTQKVVITDNEDDWMTIHIGDALFYEGHMSSFYNDNIVELLEKLGIPAQRVCSEFDSEFE